MLFRALLVWPWVCGCVAASASASNPTEIFPATDVAHYVQGFNAQDPEKVKNLILNADSWPWMTRNLPLFECPDAGLEEMYYFRFWSYRKHIKQLDFICLTEFLARKDPVSSAVGHHIMEGRWIHDNQYLDQDLIYWLRGGNDGPHDKHNYSSWTIWAAYQRYLVNHDKAFIVGMLPDFVRDYDQWESEHIESNGLYWQTEERDAMEDSINGARKVKGLRPSINSYMYGNAMAIAKVATLAGKPDIARKYRKKADDLKNSVQTQLWDPKAEFFKVRWEDGSFSTAREEIGYIPWYFELPDRGFESAWKQFDDPLGFSAPFGLMTAERRDPRFRTHGSGHGCEWDGAVWPFATAQSLTALANLLNDYPQTVVSKADYLAALQTYAKSQHLNGQPYIGEYLDETTGRWLRNDLERGRFYNHSTFGDLIISGLVGLHPSDDSTVTVKPLVPADVWDWYCLQNIQYHGHDLAIIWDKTGTKFNHGAGLTVLCDGKSIAHADKIGPISGKIPD